MSDSLDTKPDLASLLRGLREEPDADARSDAAKTLGLRREKGAVPALISLLDDSDWKPVASAAWALGEIGGVEAVDPLVRAAGHEQWRVRRRALEALGKLGSFAATRAIELGERDPNESVREVVRQVKGKLLALTLSERLREIPTLEPSEALRSLESWEIWTERQQEALGQLPASLLRSLCVVALRRGSVIGRILLPEVLALATPAELFSGEPEIDDEVWRHLEETLSPPSFSNDRLLLLLFSKARPFLSEGAPEEARGVRSRLIEAARRLAADSARDPSLREAVFGFLVSMSSEPMAPGRAELQAAIIRLLLEGDFTEEQRRTFVEGLPADSCNGQIESLVDSSLRPGGTSDLAATLAAQALAAKFRIASDERNAVRSSVVVDRATALVDRLLQVAVPLAIREDRIEARVALLLAVVDRLLHSLPGSGTKEGSALRSRILRELRERIEAASNTGNAPDEVDP